MRYLLFLFPLVLSAQSSTSTVLNYANDPSGTCPAGKLAVSKASGNLFHCDTKTGNWDLEAGFSGASNAANGPVVLDVSGNAAIGTTVLSPTKGMTAPIKGANVVIEGDSLSDAEHLGGSAGDCATNVTDTACTDYGSLALLMSAVQGTVVTKHNFATAGNKIEDLQARYTASVHPLSPAVTGVPGWLFVWTGANNYGVDTVSALETKLTTYWAGAKADGWTLVVFTVQRRGDAVQDSGEAVRRPVNSWIRSQFQTLAYDRLIDVDRLFPNPWDTVFFNSDHIHENTLGEYYIAQFVNAALRADGINQPANDSGIMIGSGTGNARSDAGSLRVLTTGAGNTATGVRAGEVVSTGNSNSMLGYLALLKETTGANNAAFGDSALTSQVGANDNSGFGKGACGAVTSGSWNTCIGELAGNSGTLLTTGNHNSLFGFIAQVNNAAAAYRTVLGAEAIGTADNTVTVGRPIDTTVVKKFNVGTEPTCMSATDLAVDATTNTKVTSASHNFVAADVGERLQITSGAGWTVADFYVVSAAGNAATLNASPAVVTTTGGTWNINRSLIVTVEAAASAADTLRICSQAADNTFAWRATY